MWSCCTTNLRLCRSRLVNQYIRRHYSWICKRTEWLAGPSIISSDRESHPFPAYQWTEGYIPRPIPRRDTKQWNYSIVINIADYASWHCSRIAYDISLSSLTAGGYFHNDKRHHNEAIRWYTVYDVGEELGWLCHSAGLYSSSIWISQPWVMMEVESQTTWWRSITRD